MQMPPHQSSGLSMHAGDMHRHHSMPVECSPLSSMFSQGSCNSSGMGIDPAVSLDSGLNEPILDPIGSLSFDGSFGFTASTDPPIGLQLRKSESFLDLINEHLKQADSGVMVT